MGRGRALRRSATGVLKDPPPLLSVHSRYRTSIRDFPLLLRSVDRITELEDGAFEAFRLARRVGVPALELFNAPHERIQAAHADLFRAAARAPRELAREAAPAVPTTVVDLTRSDAHARSLIASIALLCQTNSTRDPAVLIAQEIREGLVAEGITDAYFGALGYTPVPGIGAFYRPSAHTFCARLNHGSGLDHLFRRKVQGGWEFVVVETKSCKTDAALHRHISEQLRRAHLEARRRDGLEAQVPFSLSWVQDRIWRAQATGQLSPIEYRRFLRALEAGKLQRVISLVSCTDFDTSSRLRVPDPAQLVVDDGSGRRTPVADALVNLRLPKRTFVSLSNEIATSRHADVAYLATAPRTSSRVRIWRS